MESVYNEHISRVFIMRNFSGGIYMGAILEIQKKSGIVEAAIIEVQFGAQGSLKFGKPAAYRPGHISMGSEISSKLKAYTTYSLSDSDKDFCKAQGKYDSKDLINLCECKDRLFDYRIHSEFLPGHINTDGDIAAQCRVIAGF